MADMTTDRIFHYTSLESFALILRSRKIRFTRLDGVDDLREAQTHVGVPFGKYFFVTCWTCESAESIPQWQMYSRDMEGVRIGLPVYPFEEKALDVPAEWVRVRSSGTMRAPLSLKEIFASDYFVAPLFLDREHFAGPVVYEADVEGRYRAAVDRVEADGKAHIRINGLPKLARLKAIEWAFQREYRFALFVTPSMPVPTEGPAATPSMDVDWGAFIANSVVNGVAPPITHVDVDLADSALDELVVLTGPHCTAGGRVAVEALLEKYAPNARLERSALEGQIRRRP